MMKLGTANTPESGWHDSVRQSAGDFHPLLRRVIWLAVVYGVLIVTLTAQKPPIKSAASPAPATAREELSPAPAKVNTKPVARDEEIRQRLLSVLEAID